MLFHKITMTKKIISFFLTYLSTYIFILFLMPQTLHAQCAMCRATVENSASNGSNLIAGINTGIVYLAMMPYLAFIIVVWAWYSQSKKHQAKMLAEQKIRENLG